MCTRRVAGGRGGTLPADVTAPPPRRSVSGAGSTPIVAIGGVALVFRGRMWTSLVRSGSSTRSGPSPRHCPGRLTRSSSRKRRAARRTVRRAAWSGAGRDRVLPLAAAQHDRLLDVAAIALENAAAEREARGERLAAGELAVVRVDVRGPGVRGPVTGAGLERRPKAADDEPSDGLAGIDVDLDEVAVLARHGAGDRRDARLRVHDPGTVDREIDGRRWRCGAERDRQVAAVAAAVALVVDGQDVVGRARRRIERREARPAGVGLQVALRALADEHAGAVVRPGHIDDHDLVAAGD